MNDPSTPANCDSEPLRRDTVQAVSQALQQLSLYQLGKMLAVSRRMERGTDDATIRFGVTFSRQILEAMEPKYDADRGEREAVTTIGRTAAAAIHARNPNLYMEGFDQDAAAELIDGVASEGSDETGNW